MTVIQEDERNYSHVSFLIFLLLVGVCIIGSNAFLMSPVLHDVSSSIGSTASQTGRAVAAYGGATAFAGLFLTGVAQKLGYRLAIIFSSFTLSIGVLFTGISVSWQTLVLSQTLAGLGAGVMLPTIYAMTSILAPSGKESATLGKVISGWSLAMVAGVPISAFISDIFSWRHSYYLVFIFSVLSTIGFTSLPSDKRKTNGAQTKLLSALKTPLSKPTLLICFFYMVSFYGVYTFIGDHVQQGLGKSASYAGVIVSMYGLGFGIAGFSGNYLDAWTPRFLVKPVLLLIGFIYVIFLLLSQHFWMLLFGSCLWGFVNQIGLNCLVSILTQLDGTQRVRLMGIYSAVAYGGTMVAGVTFGILYQIWSFSALLYVASALCLTAFLISTQVYSSKKTV